MEYRHIVLPQVIVNNPRRREINHHPRQHLFQRSIPSVEEERKLYHRPFHSLLDIIVGRVVPETTLKNLPLVWNYQIPPKAIGHVKVFEIEKYTSIYKYFSYGTVVILKGVEVLI